MHLQIRLAALMVAAVLPFAATAASAQPGGNQAGDSLVNVQISDLTVLIPVGVAANLCDVNANVLAQQANTGDATCTATAESIATPGQGNGGGGNQAGNSLINVQISNVTILVPIAIAANICEVNVNVLAQQLNAGNATCQAAATAGG
ncbi:MAG: hypothetical protein E6J43_09035 [Chloroflexi bacterium]|nr:MAG: hypothetical protein E6J43_09035 [Chloroflexota bacterium]